MSDNKERIDYESAQLLLIKMILEGDPVDILPMFESFARVKNNSCVYTEMDEIEFELDENCGWMSWFDN